ncbi:MAG: L-aspartate oxidase [Kordiimonas sp.]|nr:L-aspartate oxidase [Kordiimonas sp.]
MSTYYDFDVLVIGSGAAGLSLALRLADHAKVAVISKNKLNSGATSWAQGGIAAVLSSKDTIASHVADTMAAGGGLCHEDTVQHVVEKSAACIDWLIEKGVAFTPFEPSIARPKDTYVENHYHLTREGGHSHRRVIHAADATGKVLHNTLEDQVCDHDNVFLFEHHMAVDLISNGAGSLDGRQCLGAYVLDTKNDEVQVFRAKKTVLATGGASRVYLYSSNPDGSTGDGIAMAWRMGCSVVNMEFNQFHPTCLYNPEARTFLLTEALRGEGAKLRLPNGEAFMHKFDEREELAPRDVVARAIDHEMKRLGADCVYLDISHKDADFIREHFPTIYKRCMKLGYDLTQEPIPVVPAAHYTSGGVRTNLAGQTEVDGLYAIGEVAHTGLHGANRMASNSLLECLVYSYAAANDILEKLPQAGQHRSIDPWDATRVTDSDEEVIVSHNWSELRHFMWDYVGIVRTTRRLERAARRIEMLAGEIREYYGSFRITPDLLELRNLVTVAELIVRSALLRTESRGLHYTLDYPDTDPEQARDTVLRPPRRPR